MAINPRRTKVFISYSHNDERWLKMLEPHLGSLARDRGIETWDDKRIRPGSKWRAEIDTAMASAKVAVLLVSKYFLDSDFILRTELPELLRAAKAEGAVILPVIVSPCRIGDTVLSQFQSVNPTSNTLQHMTVVKREELFVNLTERIDEILGGRPLTSTEPASRLQKRSVDQETGSPRDGPPGVLPGMEPSDGGLGVNWGPHDFELPQAEFLYFYPPGSLTACVPALANNSLETVKVTRIELVATMYRRFEKGAVELATENLTEAPLRFTAGEFPDDSDLAWHPAGENRWVVDTPFALPAHAEISLLGLGLECNEQNSQAATKVRKLFGVANLGIEYRLTMTDEHGMTRTKLAAPLRILGTLEESGDGGIDFLIGKLEPNNEAKRARLRDAYQLARQADYQVRSAIAQRLNEIEQRKAVELAEQAVAARPNDSAAHYELGVALLLAGEGEEALRSLDRALSLGHDSADVRLARGQALRSLSRVEEALADVDRTLDARPDDAAARTEKGRILLDMKRYEDALVAFDAAIRLTETSADAHCGRGLALWLLDANEDALSAFDRALAISSDMGEAHVGRAAVLSTLGRDVEAVEALRPALTLDFSDLDALHAIEGLLGELGRNELRRLLGSMGLLGRFEGGDNSRNTHGRPGGGEKEG